MQFTFGYFSLQRNRQPKERSNEPQSATLQYHPTPTCVAKIFASKQGPQKLEQQHLDETQTETNDTTKDHRLHSTRPYRELSSHVTLQTQPTFLMATRRPTLLVSTSRHAYRVFRLMRHRCSSKRRICIHAWTTCLRLRRKRRRVFPQCCSATCDTKKTTLRFLHKLSQCSRSQQRVQPYVIAPHSPPRHSAVKSQSEPSVQSRSPSNAIYHFCMPPV